MTEVTEEKVGVKRVDGKVVQVLLKHNGDNPEFYDVSQTDWEGHLEMMAGKQEPLIKSNEN